MRFRCSVTDALSLTSDGCGALSLLCDDVLSLLSDGLGCALAAQSLMRMCSRFSVMDEDVLSILRNGGAKTPTIADDVVSMETAYIRCRQPCW